MADAPKSKDTTLRWATLADAEPIAAYHHQCWLLAFAPLVEPAVMQVIEPRVDRWTNWLTEGSGFTTVVAVDESDRPVAHASLRDDELVHLFVDPARHRTGLGRVLLGIAERMIRQAGYRGAVLHTIVGNAPAIELYESCGWTVTDETVLEELSNGSSYTEHVLRKSFDQSTSERSHIEANRENWDTDAPNWVDGGRRLWAGEPQWGEMQVPESTVRVLPDLAGLDVVELGCGTGYVSSWCLRAGAKSAVGLDNSLQQLRTAQILQQEFELAFPLVWADAERTPFQDDSFDVAINEYGAAMWCAPERWVAEAARILRPGGKLVFLTWSTLLAMMAPDFEDERTSTRLLRPQRDMYQVTFPDTDGVEFALSHGQWIDLLRTHGFRIDRLAELYAPPAGEGGPDRYSYYDASWARNWPTEEVWTATL